MACKRQGRRRQRAADEVPGADSRLAAPRCEMCERRKRRGAAATAAVVRCRRPRCRRAGPASEVFDLRPWSPGVRGYGLAQADPPGRGAASSTLRARPVGPPSRTKAPLALARVCTPPGQPRGQGGCLLASLRCHLGTSRGGGGRVCGRSMERSLGRRGLLVTAEARPGPLAVRTAGNRPATAGRPPRLRNREVTRAVAGHAGGYAAREGHDPRLAACARRWPGWRGA